MNHKQTKRDDQKSNKKSPAFRDAERKKKEQEKYSKGGF